MQIENEMGEIHQQQQKLMVTGEEDRSSSVFSMNQNGSQYNFQQQIFHQEVQNLPTRQDLFQYQHHFQSFLQQQQQYQEQQNRLQNQHCSLTQDNTAPVPSFSLNFKPDLDQRKIGVVSSGEDAFLRGSEQYVPETRRSALAMPHGWQNQEDSAFRQPFWKPSEEKDKDERPEMNQNKGYGYSEVTEENNCLEGKSRLFGELEAICRHAAMAKTDRSGSVSSLTGENLPNGACLPRNFNEACHLNANAFAVAAARFRHDHDSETSIGDEEPSRMVQKSKKRKKRKDQLGSMALFFESLVNQLMDHQEVLYRKFVEMIERLDIERKEREEAWRRQELEKLQKEADTKAHERALASSREASIVAYLEKITGQSIKPPPREPPLESQPAISAAAIHELSSSNETRNVESASVITKRWPKAEVEALILIRSGLESRFQEPGLKGPIWEEISNSMASLGFQRSAKRCKEKWENINKYFRKSKENSKDRSQKFKTCQYFDQLDLLYSKSMLNGSHSCSSSSERQAMRTDS